jgi:AsmA family protein
VIFSRVELDRPRLRLRRDAQGRANWTARLPSKDDDDATAEAPPDLPVVRNFIVNDGRLDLRDALLRLELTGLLEAHERASAAAESQPFRVDGRGRLNDRPFRARVTGGALVNLQPDRPYPFDLAVTAADLRVAARGRIAEPFDLARLTLEVEASGRDLADLFFVTRLVLPNTPPFRVAAHVEREARRWQVTNLRGTLGDSDVRGNLAIDASRRQPELTGALVSTRLVLSDLVASLGSRNDAAVSGQDAGAPTPAATARAPPRSQLFPDARLQVNRLGMMNAVVTFRADQVITRTWPLERVALSVRLQDGVLALDPFEFVMPQGQVAGTAQIDVRSGQPDTRLDLRVRGMQLEQFKGKAADAIAPLGGTLQARVNLRGGGASVHEFVSRADGSASLVLPRGEIRAALAELTGINLARGLGLLLTGDQDRASIRCGIAQFAVRDGVMRAENVVLDTEDVRITGRGEIRLGPEEVDLSIRGEPKKLRLARVKSPVEIGGTLRDPAIGVDARRTLEQGGVAAVLGAAVAPLAAVLAFVDPGLAEDENCAQLLAASSQDTSGRAAPKPR